MKVQKTIQIEAPATEAYGYWTQFERFPLLMPGVLAVHQINARKFYWRVEVWAHEMEWEAEITEQKAGRSIAWRSTKGHPHQGEVTFDSVGPHTTEVRLTLEYPVNGPLEWLADALGAVSSAADGCLKSFRDFIESRPTADDSWPTWIEKRWSFSDDEEGLDAQRCATLSTFAME